MITCRLYAKDGTCLHDQVLPPFLVDPPDAIRWQDPGGRTRIFVAPDVDSELARHLPDGDGVYAYEEAVVYTLDPALVGWSERREKAPR